MTDKTPFPLNQAVLCDTRHLSIIKVSGDDAQSFLQGQFSNDVKLLNNLDTQLNSYNSPKGRMYAAFRLCHFDDSYYILLPADITETVLKRLKMFVMRSNVQLEDVSQQWKTLGISGEGIDEILQAHKISIPENKHQASKYGNAFVVNLCGEIPRYLLIVPEDDIIKVKNTLKETLPLAGSEHWKRLDIHEGIPNIYSNTMESFVAQMINFQLIDGVSFTKGCYPGQEVVARMHYLGKLKKRMYRVTLNSKASPDDKIYDASGDNEQSVGQIVDAQPNENGGYDALAVLQVAVETSNALKLGSLQGESVVVETLPYSFPEEE